MRRQRESANWILGWVVAGAVVWGGSACWGQSCVLENPHLRYSLSGKDGRLVDRHFENRLTRMRLALPPEEFRLEFQDGTTIGALDCKVKIAGPPALGAGRCRPPSPGGRQPSGVRATRASANQLGDSETRRSVD